MPEEQFSLLEFGRVLGRLDAQDREIIALRNDVKSLLDMASRGKGSLMTFMVIGSIVSTILGWTVGRWLH